jgi:rhodanese-related sulfurtransferase
MQFHCSTPPFNPIFRSFLFSYKNSFYQPAYFVPHNGTTGFIYAYFVGYDAEEGNMENKEILLSKQRRNRMSDQNKCQNDNKGLQKQQDHIHEHEHGNHQNHDHHHSHDHSHKHDHHHHHKHDHDDDYDNEFDIYPQEFLDLYEQPSFSGKIIDVREDWEFERIKIEGSISVPLRQFPEQIDRLDQDETYYLICSQGIRSSFASEYLLSLGFNRVYNIQTGIFGICDYLESISESPEWLKTKNTD